MRPAGKRAVVLHLVEAHGLSERRACRLEGGWALISDDHGIYKNPQERAAMVSARIIGFFLHPAWRKPKVSEFERAARLIRWWPKLMNQCEIVRPPAAFGVPIRPTSRLESIPFPRR